jgi:hypothetical protein
MSRTIADWSVVTKTLAGDEELDACTLER